MGETIIEKLLEDRTGTIVLSVTQPEPWDAPGVLGKFQEQLNGYISAIRDGALVERFPQYQGKKFKIRVVCYQLPPEDVHRKLDLVNHTLSQLGIGFEIMQIDVASQAERKDPLKEFLVSVFNRLRRKKP